MKQIFSNVIAGLVGGLICFFLFKNLNEETKEQTNQVAKLVSEKISSVPVTGPDFVNAAKLSTSGVVHIHAEESDNQIAQKQQKRRRGQSDFLSIEDFFGGDFFGRSFYNREEGSGSGVIISKDGYIVTNNHVVGFADNIVVTTSDGKKFDAKKIGTDPLSDLAVIKIETNDLSPISYGNSDVLKVGEWVLAVGNPFGYLTSTVTAGIVSAKGRDLDMIENDKSIEEFIQTDAAINPGNSGGALVNSAGELVGINTAIATPTGVFAGYSFAIPSNLVKNIVKSIIETGGNIERVSLGIGGYDVDKAIEKEFGLRVSSGFYVEQLDLKSPAKLAGILPGDVIVKVNNNKVIGFNDIDTALKFSKSGDLIQIVVNRNGKELTIPTKLRKGL
jgi:serine protease Do